jgi:hypothetical protein
MFGPEREEGTKAWRKLHNVEVHNLYFSPNSIRIVKPRWMSLTMHVACMRELRNAYKIVFAKREGKRPLGRPMCTCEDNIEMYCDMSTLCWMTQRSC